MFPKKKEKTAQRGGGQDLNGTQETHLSGKAPLVEETNHNKF